MPFRQTMWVPVGTVLQCGCQVVSNNLSSKCTVRSLLGQVFGFVARFGGPDWLWYPFIIFNGLQGTFIFVAFDLKRKVLAAVVERVTGRKPTWASVSKDSGPSSGASGRTAVFKLSQSSQESMDSRLRKLPAALRSKLSSSGSGRTRRAAKQPESPTKRRSEQSSPQKSQESSPTKRRGEKQETSPKRRVDKSPPKPKRATKQDSPHQRRSQMVRGASEIDDPVLLRLVSHQAPAAAGSSLASKSDLWRQRNDPHVPRGSRRRTRDDSHVPEPGPSRSPPRRAGSFESLPSSERLEHKIAEAKRLLRDLAEQPAEKRRPREKRHGALRSPPAEESVKRRSASHRDDRREKDRGAGRPKGVSRFR